MVIWLVPVFIVLIVAVLSAPRDRWEPRRGGWPHGKDGWCTYNPYRQTILDTGLTYAEALEACRILNRRKR